MALYIRDAEVDRLIDELLAIAKGLSKTDAVRQALQHEIERRRSEQSFDTRNAEVLAMADRLGPTNPTFDQKQFSDEMWGE